MKVAPPPCCGAAPPFGGGVFGGLLRPNIAEAEPALIMPAEPHTTPFVGTKQRKRNFLSGLHSSIAKAEPSHLPAHETVELQAVTPLAQSPSMVRLSAMMAMEWRWMRPEVRTMGGEAVESSRGLLDRQLREREHGDSSAALKNPSANLSLSHGVSSSSWMGGMDGLSALYTGMFNQGCR